MLWNIGKELHPYLSKDPHPSTEFHRITNPFKLRVLTQREYDSLPQREPHTLYHILDTDSCMINDYTIGKLCNAYNEEA